MSPFSTRRLADAEARAFSACDLHISANADLAVGVLVPAAVGAMLAVGVAVEGGMMVRLSRDKAQIRRRVLREPADREQS